MTTLPTETKVIAAEAGHWYSKDGSPVYEVPTAKGIGFRATTLADARKRDLVPSVTNILNVAAKPGLESWKAAQILQSALTLPRRATTKVVNGRAVFEEEPLDDYAVRVIEDSKAQSQKARDKGTELHAAIEDWIKGQGSLTWGVHIEGVSKALEQLGIDLTLGNAEHSFASPLGYGGKIDFHNNEPLICDFKTKDKIDDKKQLVWPEHVQQLAAYGFGVFPINMIASTDPFFRAINVFIGVTDKQVRVFEHEWPDIVEAFEQFKLLLTYWQRSKKFGPYAKGNK